MFLLPLLLAAGSASPINAADQVRAAVSAAMGGQVPESSVTISPDFRQEPCAAPLVAAARGMRSVEVRCDGPGGWKIYVPVQVQQIDSVVVLAKPARQGVPISPDQLTVQRRDTAALAGTPFVAMGDVVGKTPRRGLPPGAVVLEADVTDAAHLRRGDPVSIRSGTGPVVVEMEGRALGNATLGGSVSVENVVTRRIVRGRVVSEGVVQVGNQGGRVSR